MNKRYELYLFRCVGGRKDEVVCSERMSLQNARVKAQQIADSRRLRVWLERSLGRSVGTDIVAIVDPVRADGL